jgi:hypothetical protein
VRLHLIWTRLNTHGLLDLPEIFETANMAPSRSQNRGFNTAPPDGYTPYPTYTEFRQPVVPEGPDYDQTEPAGFIDDDPDSLPTRDEVTGNNVQQLDAAGLSQLPAADILRQTLRLHSIVWSPSSYGRLALRVDDSARQPVTCIGDDDDGEVFEQLGRREVFKTEPWAKPCLRDTRHRHDAVYDAFREYEGLLQSGIEVPFPGRYIGNEDWRRLYPNVPRRDSAGGMMAMERILPIYKVARRALVDLFLPGAPDAATIDAIVNNTDNKHCLARPYLGTGKREHQFHANDFSLRDFPLCLLHLEALGIDVHGLAKEMGKALAVMHWGAEINAVRVNFVLGTTQVAQRHIGLPYDPTQEGKQSSHYTIEQCRQIGLWAQGFGCCEFLDLTVNTEEKVYHNLKLAMAPLDERNYIPDCLESPELFSIFRNAYLAVAWQILERKGLARKFSPFDLMQQYEEFRKDSATPGRPGSSIGS